MPATPARRDITQVQFTRELDVAGAHYQVTAATSADLADTIVIDVLGAGPGGEAIQGNLTAPTSALAHLGPLLDQVLGGLAVAHGIDVDRSLGTAPAARRRGDRRPGAPLNAGQPWTDELKADLKRRWLAADVNAAAEPLIAAIAQDLGRTHDSIRSQLQRQKLDPERPGSTYAGPGRP
jgi:hypothetical protein